MDRQETAKFLMIMREYYPHDATASTIKTKVTAWQLVLNDMPFEKAVEALIAFTANDTRGFPPVPGQIIAAANRMDDQGDELSEMEAWDLVRRAAQNSGYQAQKEFERLPPLIRSIVHSSGQLRDWGMVDESTFNTVIQSNFLRSFRAKKSSFQHWMNVPEGIRALASNTAMRSLEGPHNLDPLELENKRNEMRRLLEQYGREENLPE